jgi:TPR repeat protein
MNTLKTIIIVSLVAILSACSSFTPTVDNCNNLFYQRQYELYTDKCSTLGASDAGTQYRLYQIYKSGVGGTIDLPKSNYYLAQAASAGYPKAMLATCSGYYTGAAGVQSDERVIFWCTRAYERGMNGALTYLANTYYKQANYSQALKYFLLQSDKSSQTEYIIGLSYLKTEKTVNNGYEWIKKAFNHNNADAKTYVKNLSGKYGKCSIEDAYFRSDLSYQEALEVCKDVNDGNLTAATAILHTKKFFRTF